MNASLIIFIIMVVLGVWKIPSTEREARSPLAPYRALWGVLYLLIAFVAWCAWAGAR